MLGKKKELEIPVYLFMGFLEAGKTTFIQKHWKKIILTTEKEHFYLPVKREWKNTTKNC